MDDDEEAEEECEVRPPFIKGEAEEEESGTEIISLESLFSALACKKGLSATYSARELKHLRIHALCACICSKKSGRLNSTGKVRSGSVERFRRRNSALSVLGSPRAPPPPTRKLRIMGDTPRAWGEKWLLAYALGSIDLSI